MEASELARLFVALRKRHPKVCPECGRTFQGLAIQRFCSRACQHRVNARTYYWRHREAVLARQAAWRRRRKGLQGQQQEGEA